MIDNSKRNQLLNDEARKVRRALLIVSFVSFAVWWTGVIPLKISAFGIDFAPSDKRIILILLGLVNLYFLASFIIYSLDDILNYRIKQLDSILFPKPTPSHKTSTQDVFERKYKYPLEKKQRILRQLRILFLMKGPLLEIGLPILFGAVSTFWFCFWTAFFKSMG